MISNRQKPYESKHSDRLIEKISDQLTNNIRSSVVTIQLHKSGSKPWVAQVPVLAKIARVVSLESEIDKKTEHETLWEGEEIILRSIVVSVAHAARVFNLIRRKLAK